MFLPKNKIWYTVLITIATGIRMNKKGVNSTLVSRMEPGTLFFQKIRMPNVVRSSHHVTRERKRLHHWRIWTTGAITWYLIKHKSLMNYDLEQSTGQLYTYTHYNNLCSLSFLPTLSLAVKTSSNALSVSWVQRLNFSLQSTGLADTKTFNSNTKFRLIRFGTFGPL